MHIKNLLLIPFNLKFIYFQNLNFNVIIIFIYEKFPTIQKDFDFIQVLNMIFFKLYFILIKFHHFN